MTPRETTRGSGIVTALVALAAGAIGCHTAPHAVGERVQTRAQLIGGTDALGDVGDLKLSNGKVQFIIQGITTRSNFSRGWGIYGGSLLDADLIRPSAGNSANPPGHDHFGEMFPAYFLEAISPTSVEVGNDGSDGKPATIVVKGSGAPFISLARQLLQIAGLDNTDPNSGLPSTSEGIQFSNTYSLGPTDQFLTITTTLAQPNGDLAISSASIPGAPAALALPFGHVVLFGNKNNVFMPGAGFDLYYSLEDSYALPARLPALPGLQTDLIASRTPDGVSYGVASAAPADPETSYVYHNRAVIPGAKPDDMLVPFIAGSFTGVFTGQAPAVIPAGDTFSYTTYFIVGQGDVGSVRDVAYKIKGQSTGGITARIREEATDQVVPGAMLLVLDSNGSPYSEYDPDPNGRILGQLVPGNYSAVVVCDNRPRSKTVSFTVKAGQTTEIPGSDGRTLTVPRNALLDIMIHESKDGSVRGSHPGRALPAKVSVVGTSPAVAANDGKEPRKFLFNLPLGDRMLATDGLPDDHNDPNTRQYIQRVILSGSDGLASGDVPPGDYHVYVSRGPEYSTADLGVLTLASGQTYEKSVELKRVIDSTGYVSADFHVHSGQSIDGYIALDQRVLSYAAEGVEVLTATDHNIVTDYAPLVESMNMVDYVHSTVGLEMTTLEMGHFNAFPIKYESGSVTHGSFQWMNLPPADLFQTLRSQDGIGLPDTIVQVNHPRDSILGYFREFNVNQDTGGPIPGSALIGNSGPAFGNNGIGNFSWNFDAMEVYNGKRHELVRTYRMPATRPENLPAGYWTADEVGGRPGDIVRTPCGTQTPCVYSQQAIAFPGSIEDWFNLINSGGQTVASMYGANPDLALNAEVFKPITATGNSDSHQLYFEEAGYPRNWVRVPTDEPRDVTDAQVANAVREHQVVLSNGPYLEVTLTDPSTKTVAQVGDLLSTTQPTLTLHIKVQATPWIAVDEIEIDSNATAGTAVGTPTAVVIPVSTDPSQAVRFDADVSFPVPANANGNPDAWVVVIARSSKSMFPYVTPLEQPPLQISDAISTIAGPLGLSGPSYGDLFPNPIAPTMPYAMSNPIWIDTNGDHVAFGRTATSGVASGSQGLTAAPLPKPILAPKITDQQRFSRSSNLFKLFRAWGDGHGR